ICAVIVSGSFRYSDFDIIAPSTMFYLHRDIYRIILPTSTRLYREQRNFGGQCGGRLDGSLRRPASHCPEQRRRPEMSATFATIVRPQLTKRPGAFSRIFSAGRDGITRYFVRRAAIARLRELDDRVLHDIGIERSQIEAAVCGLITPSQARRR